MGRIFSGAKSRDDSESKGPVAQVLAETGLVQRQCIPGVDVGTVVDMDETVDHVGFSFDCLS